MIRAETHPDNHAMEVHFDAQPWFEQAFDEEILELVNCEATYSPPEWGDDIVYGQDYPSDYVAHHAAEYDEKVQRMFKYIEDHNEDHNNVETMGFECYINGQDTIEWMKKNRSNLNWS